MHASPRATPLAAALAADLPELRRDAWHGGQLLAFSGLDGATDYAQALTARTSFGAPGLDLCLPARGRVRFPGGAGAGSLVAGDWLLLESGDAPLRAAFLDTHHLLLEGPCEVLDCEPGLAVARAPGRTLIGAAARFDASCLAADLDAALSERSRWLRAARLPAALPPARRRTLLKALSILKTQVYTPEGPIRHRWTTPDRWPHRRMWLWDSAFHAIGWRHIDPALARDALSAVLDMQAPDGFVAHMMDPAGCSRITQPPVLALGASLVQESAPDAAWLAALYPRLGACVEWDLAHRDSDGGGLLEWEIEGNPLCRSGESGMDNSPRFDAATRMDAVDFNAFAAHECELLAGFAAALGRAAEAEQWRARHARLCRLIGERLWSEPLGFFVDYDLARGAPSPVLASSGFLPLLCGAASTAQAERLAAQLRDPTRFGTAFPIPSIAASDTARYAKDMWRGPVWINVNWLAARGFDRYGLGAVAADLRERTMREVEDACDRHGVLFEFYDDRREVEPPRLLRKGRCAPEASPYHQVFHDYGWTASLYVDLVYTTSARRGFDTGRRLV